MDNQLTGVRRWLILVNVSLSVFMATLDGSIVNIALPTISNNLHVNISSVQWVVTSYLLAISVLLLIWGKISDLYGKKNIFAFGFIIFTIGSGLCGMSNSLEMLVFARVLQAFGASAMMALSQGIVTSIFPANERGKALGITGTTVAIGSLVGPSLGGFLVHLFGWQSIFFINIPIGIIGTILTFIIIPEMHESPEVKAFDYKGSAMFMISLLLLFLSLLFLQDGVIPMAVFIPILIVAVAVLWVFVRYEKKVVNPLIHMELFKIHEFSFGISSAFLSFVALSATILFIPFYLLLALKVDTLSAGLLISAYPITVAILAPISGMLSDKFSYRPLTIAGLCINTVVLFMLSTLTAATSHFEIVLLMVLLGVGVAVFQSPNNSSVMGSVHKSQLGVAGAMNALFRNLGLVSGTALSVLIFTFVTRMNINSLSGGSLADVGLFLKGFRYVLIFAGMACLVAVGVSMRRAVVGKDISRNA